METPSGLTSVVSTVAGGLETPDFIELRKNTSGVRELGEPSGQRQLYQVVPERQTNIRGLVGSERGYDISAVSGPANVEVLGQEGRGKVRPVCFVCNLHKH
jgi:splicing factor 3B subunit 2